MGKNLLLIFVSLGHTPETLETTDSCSDIIEDPSDNTKNTYRVKNGLDYPVNVGRMISRETATTHYIFAADVELYPR